MKKTVLLFVILLFAANANATRYYVNASAAGTNNGLTWTNAFVSLQTALSAAIAGDEIWVATGTYKAGSSRSSSFVMKNGVNLYGGFAGTETAISQRDIATAPTALSGDIGQAGDNTDNTYRIVKMQNIALGIVFDGFRVVSGYNAADGSEGAGAFIDSNPGTISIKNCIFFDNYAYGMGGGLYIDVSNVNFENCEFLYNSTFDYGGGAIYSANVSSSNISLISCKFIGNTARNGAAINFDGQNLTMDRNIITGNTATTYSIIAVSDITGTFKLTNSLVAGNLLTDNTGSVIVTSDNEFNSCYLINNTICHNRNSSTSQMLHEAVKCYNMGANIRNCIIYGNSTFGVNQVSPNNYVANCILQVSFSSGTNNIFTDPLFVMPGTTVAAPFNATLYDYSLTAASLGINSGNNTLLLTGFESFDLFGNTRVQQSTVDRGAIESSSLGMPGNSITDIGQFIFSDHILTFENIDDFLGKEARIYDVHGKLVDSFKIVENNIRLNQSSGLYFISINGAFKAKKIIIP